MTKKVKRFRFDGDRRRALDYALRKANSSTNTERAIARLERSLDCNWQEGGGIPEAVWRWEQAKTAGLLVGELMVTLVGLDQETERHLDRWDRSWRIQKKLKTLRAALVNAESEALRDVFRSQKPNDRELRKVFMVCASIWQEETGHPMRAERRDPMGYYSGWPREQRVVLEEHPMFIILEYLDIQIQQSSIDYLLSVDWTQVDKSCERSDIGLSSDTRH